MTSEIASLRFARRSAWVIGFITVFCAGSFSWPVNLQATLIRGVTLILLWSRIRNQSHGLNSPFVYLIIGLALCIFFMFTTNTWLVIALHASILFLITDFLLMGFHGERSSTIGSHLVQMWRLLIAFIKTLFSRSTYRDFLSISSGSNEDSENRGRSVAIVFLSVVGGIFLSYVFHLLFSQVNEAYAKFMNAFMDWVWSVLLKNLLFSIVHAYFWYCLLAAKKPADRQSLQGQRKLPVSSAIIALLAVIFVTGVFSIFQTRFITVEMAALKFSDLSKYTQQGFAQLIIAIILGYCVVLYAMRVKLNANTRIKMLVVLIGLFIGEMILATGFSAHKIFLLQLSFGFKDERILASVGIIFILFSFFMLIARSVKGRSDFAGYRYQIMFLLIAALGLNVMNVDRLSTNARPIQYFKNGMPYHDYSYLLGNSYDNVDDWRRVIQEMQTINPPAPEQGYFWGHESPGRSDVFGGDYTPICTTLHIAPVEDTGSESESNSDDHFSAPTDRLFTAYRKYNNRFGGDSQSAQESFRLERFLDFNVREYRAYVLARDDQRELERFEKYLTDYCEVQK